MKAKALLNIVSGMSTCETEIYCSYKQCDRCLINTVLNYHFMQLSNVCECIHLCEYLGNRRFEHNPAIRRTVGRREGRVIHQGLLPSREALLAGVI